jgi:hypothetical protein
MHTCVMMEEQGETNNESTCLRSDVSPEAFRKKRIVIGRDQELE